MVTVALSDEPARVRAGAVHLVLQQELAIADWVWQQLSPMTHKYLRLAETGRATR